MFLLQCKIRPTIAVLPTYPDYQEARCLEEEVTAEVFTNMEVLQKVYLAPSSVCLAPQLTGINWTGFLVN
jgi:hypothetical protein